MVISQHSYAISKHRRWLELLFNFWGSNRRMLFLMVFISYCLITSFERLFLSVRGTRSLPDDDSWVLHILDVRGGSSIRGSNHQIFFIAPHRLTRCTRSLIPALHLHRSLFPRRHLLFIPWFSEKWYHFFYYVRIFLLLPVVCIFVLS